MKITQPCFYSPMIAQALPNGLEPRTEVIGKRKQAAHGRHNAAVEQVDAPDVAVIEPTEDAQRTEVLAAAQRARAARGSGVVRPPEGLPSGLAEGLDRVIARLRAELGAHAPVKRCLLTLRRGLLDVHSPRVEGRQ